MKPRWKSAAEFLWGVFGFLVGGYLVMHGIDMLQLANLIGLAYIGLGVLVVWSGGNRAEKAWKEL